MAKLVLGLLGAALVVMLAGPTAERGLQDLRRSWTRWSYPTIRDMRYSVALKPQKKSHRTPDSLTVPVGGWGDGLDQAALDADREAATKDLVNPVPMSAASVVRGDTLYRRMCVPCHGKTMIGDGPVAASFMPPPDLLAESTRQRTDGFIFAYIRHGGVVMPKYGQSVSAQEAWDLVNYVREQQRKTPR